MVLGEAVVEAVAAVEGTWVVGAMGAGLGVEE